MATDITNLPEKIGNFRIISKIGQGGMGAVFRAVHGTLERPVALKILPPELASNQEYVQRFLREARTVAALRHDNIVQVYDAGEEQGRYYIAMELVDGCSLMKHIEGKRIGEDEGLKLLLQAAKGLAAAHIKGLVHRDIKPENMLLGNDSILRLVDFGLVMESSSTTQLTATGACLGTPMYMSPEQADGEHADARTDIYSLGVTFYRVFTGQPPFTSPTVMNLLFKHKFEAPPDPKGMRPDLSQNVRNLLLHMMAKRREDRPQSAQALVEMIEGMAQGKAIPEPPVYVPSSSSLPPTMISPGATRMIPAGRPVAPKLIGAAVLAVIIGAGVLFAVLRPGKQDGHDPAALAGKPPVAPGGPDRRALGDAAFEAGRYAEALEQYAAASAEKPADEELKGKVVLARTACETDRLVRDAEALENKGDLEAAATTFEKAALKGGAKARERAERLRAAIAKNTGLSGRQRNAEVDALSQQASELEKAADFEKAAERYSQAANLADGAARTLLADKALECRRQDYLAKAMAAEVLNNSADAEKWYRKALDIKADALVQQKLEAVQQKSQAGAADALYLAAMREGQRALDAGDLPQASKQFIAALALKPASADAAAKLKEADGRQLIAKGDACRTAGDQAGALSAYLEARQKCPALDAMAAARIQALAAAPVTPQPPAAANPPAATMARIDDLVRAQKDREAAAEAAAALKLYPGSAELKSIQTCMEGLERCTTTYGELVKIAGDGVDVAREMADIEDGDERAKDLRDGLSDLRKNMIDKPAAMRAAMLSHDYAKAMAGATSVRADAQALAGKLGSGGETCERRAEKAAEKGTVVKGPFGFSVGVGTDKKKAEKYRKAAEEFRRLETKARAFGK
jgi:serine/threonine-protein kinase